MRQNSYICHLASIKRLKKNANPEIPSFSFVQQLTVINKSYIFEKTNTKKQLQTRVERNQNPVSSELKPLKIWKRSGVSSE